MQFQLSPRFEYDGPKYKYDFSREYWPQADWDIPRDARAVNSGLPRRSPLQPIALQQSNILSSPKQCASQVTAQKLVFSSAPSPGKAQSATVKFTINENARPPAAHATDKKLSAVPDSHKVAAPDACNAAVANNEDSNFAAFASATRAFLNCYSAMATDQHPSKAGQSNKDKPNVIRQKRNLKDSFKEEEKLKEVAEPGKAKRVRLEPAVRPVVRTTRNSSKVACEKVAAQFTVGKSSPVSTRTRSNTKLKEFGLQAVSRQCKSNNTKTAENYSVHGQNPASVQEQQAEPLDAQDDKLPFQSLANRVQDFFTKPQPSRPLTRSQALLLTEPQEPELHTKTRTRPRRFKPCEEEEVEKIAQLPAFKARPLNPNIIKTSAKGTAYSGKGGSSTLQCSMAGCAVQANTVAGTKHKHFVFQAQPVAHRTRKANNLQKSMKMAGGRNASITVPVSPVLLTKLRSHQPPTQEPERPRSKNRNKDPVKGLTVPKPFNLQTEVRGQKHEENAKAEQQQQMKQLKRKRDFKANKVPSTLIHPDVMPASASPHLTFPDPFCLRSLARHETYRSKWQADLEEEEQTRKEKAAFKAQPVPDTDAVFFAHGSEKPLTVPQAPVLSTDQRAEDRAVFDEYMKDKQRRLEEQKRLLQLQQEMEEAERQQAELEQMQWKGASKVPDFSKPFRPQPSNQPVTVPESPKFQTSKRARIR